MSSVSHPFPDAAPTVARGVSHHLAAATAIALVPVLLLAIAHFSEWPAASTGDFAQYVLHARALLEGRPYTDTGYLFQPTAQTIGPVAYPPGLPLTLVPLLGAGLDPILALRMIVLVSLVTFLVIVVIYFSRREERWVALAAAAMAGVAIESGRATLLLGSDLGFAALTMGTLLLVDRPGPYGWRRMLAVTALGAAAMAYRFPGIALVPAIAIQAFLRPRSERARRLAVVAIWVVLGLAVLALVEPLRDNLGSQVTRVLNSFQRLPRRLVHYGPIAGVAMTYPFASDRANDFYHVVGGLLALVGMFHVVRRYAATALGLFVVLYVPMIMATPFIEPRFFWPVFPLLAVAMAVGAQRVAMWGLRPRPVAARRVVQVSLAAVLVLATLKALRTQPPRSLLGDPDMHSLLAWTEQQADRSSMRVLFFNPRLFTFQTGIPAMGVPSRQPAEILRIAERTGITHLILGNPSADVRAAEGPLAEYMASAESAATLEFSNPTFTVYRLPPGT